MCSHTLPNLNLPPRRETELIDELLCSVAFTFAHLFRVIIKHRPALTSSKNLKWNFPCHLIYIPVVPERGTRSTSLAASSQSIPWIMALAAGTVELDLHWQSVVFVCKAIWYTAFFFPVSFLLQPRLNPLPDFLFFIETDIKLPDHLGRDAAANKLMRPPVCV